MIAWLWFLTGWSFAGSAIWLLWRRPELLLEGHGHASLPPFVHLIALGVVLSAHYGAQAERWRLAMPKARMTHEWTPWLLGVWALHTTGVVVFVRGLAARDDSGAAWANLGAHYLLPTAIVISIGSGIWHRRRHRLLSTGATRIPHLLSASGLPFLGLLVAMPLGVLLIMDRLTGRYGFYGFPQIGLHALAGAFLFVLPAQWPRRLSGPGGAVAPEGAAMAAGTFKAAGTGKAASPVKTAAEPGARSIAEGILVLLAGIGLLAYALDQGIVGSGWKNGTALGLALLGAVALYAGMPAPHDWLYQRHAILRRLPWAIFGVLLLHAALSAWRGIGLEEAVPLANRIAAWFLLGVAAPESLFGLLSSTEPRPDDPTRMPGEASPLAIACHAALLCGAFAALGAQIAGIVGIAEVSALLWIVGWSGVAWLGAMGLMDWLTMPRARE